MDFQQQWDSYRQRAETALQAVLPDDSSRLAEAMRYSALNGGKRFRAMLVYASGEMLGAKSAVLDAPAAVLELIHAYSLIHDDLPAMDNDVLRRGQPTCHIAFDEATAILAGDALQTLAFEVLAEADVADPCKVAMLHTLAQASGFSGMAGGQSLDMIATSQTLTLDALKTVHQKKTGALITAAVSLGALAAGSNPKALEQLEKYGRALGLAFQVADDVLDLTQSSETLGKPAGSDVKMGKNTYPALMGLNAAREYAQALVAEALESLTDFGDNSAFLRQLAEFAVNRNH